MVTEPSTTSRADVRYPEDAEPSGSPSHHSGRRKMPRVFWLIIAAAIIGGTMLGILLALATAVALHADKTGSEVGFGITGLACLIGPVALVWTTLHKLWAVAEQDSVYE